MSQCNFIYEALPQGGFAIYEKVFRGITPGTPQSALGGIAGPAAPAADGPARPVGRPDSKQGLTAEQVEKIPAGKGLFPAGSGTTSGILSTDPRLYLVCFDRAEFKKGMFGGKSPEGLMKSVFQAPVRIRSQKSLQYHGVNAQKVLTAKHGARARYEVWSPSGKDRYSLFDGKSTHMVRLAEGIYCYMGDNAQVPDLAGTAGLIAGADKCTMKLKGG